ncbi:hypothetical protein PHMEG_00025950 [Phytophthora megakarya]|uniref:Uncharacterized protein n=1 Tax=Phytophthora megakarya TaxID=4795 RepID=A0A225VDB2_9STRA|nr:hypothetical protein PHMEG_00025950 [Phytophthora megakarya]
MQIHADLGNSKKRERTPRRASPMSLVMLSRIISFLQSDEMFNETMRSRKSGNEIRFDCFTIRDRKTDHDPLASRTYSLHDLPTERLAAEALTYVARWFAYASSKLHHPWHDDDYAFPSLTKRPRGGSKKRKRTSTLFANPPGLAGIYLGTKYSLRRTVVAAEARNKDSVCTGDLKVVWEDLNELGESLDLDAISCSNAILESIADIDYGRLEIDDDGPICRIGSTDADTTLKKFIEGLRNTVKGIGGGVRVSAEAVVESTNGRTVDTTTMVSELRMLALGVNTPDSIGILTLRATSIARG